MPGMAWKTIVLAAVASSGFLAAAETHASDRERWDRWEHWEHRHDHRHSHGHHHGRGRDDDRPPVVIVERQPIIVERARPRPAPVMMAPVMMAPMGNYGPPPDPNVTFNF